LIAQTPIPVIWFDVSSSRAPFAFLAALALIGAGLDRRHWRWAGVAAAAAAIMAGCGTLALLVLARVNRPVQLPQLRRRRARL
jgi:hypothetical protein